MIWRMYLTRISSKSQLRVFQNICNMLWVANYEKMLRNPTNPSFSELDEMRAREWEITRIYRNHSEKWTSIQTLRFRNSWNRNHKKQKSLRILLHVPTLSKMSRNKRKRLREIRKLRIWINSKILWPKNYMYVGNLSFRKCLLIHRSKNFMTKWKYLSN